MRDRVETPKIACISNLGCEMMVSIEGNIFVILILENVDFIHTKKMCNFWTHHIDVMNFLSQNSINH
jgi:hypothetical protein